MNRLSFVLLLPFLLTAPLPARAAVLTPSFDHQGIVRDTKAVMKPLLVALGDEMDGELPAAARAYAAVSKRSRNEVQGFVDEQLERCLDTWLRSVERRLARLDDESLRCGPAYRDAVRLEVDTLREEVDELLHDLERGWPEKTSEMASRRDEYEVRFAALLARLR